MAKIEFIGIDEYMRQLSTLGKSSQALCKRALYDGAAVLADTVRDEIEKLPTTDRYGDPQLPLGKEKEGLLEGLGIARMKENDGRISTRVDFDGYNTLKSKKYPNGHPNSMIARAINSGTSRRPKNPFMARAVKKAREKAQKAMAARMDADINEIMNKE